MIIRTSTFIKLALTVLVSLLVVILNLFFVPLMFNAASWVAILLGIFLVVLSIIIEFVLVKIFRNILSKEDK